MKRPVHPRRSSAGLRAAARRLAPRLAAIAEVADAVVALPLSAVPDDPSAWLTATERARLEALGERRAASYRASRAALKLLARVLGIAGKNTPDPSIETAGDDERPVLIVDGAARPYVSVSHDDGYVIAVAGSRPIGVDVERISRRLIAAAPRFVFADEMDRLHKAVDASLDSPAVLARIWTAKEACGKAFGLPLFEAIRAVRVESIGETQSRATVRGRTVAVYHAEIGEHVVSVVFGDEAAGTSFERY